VKGATAIGAAIVAAHAAGFVALAARSGGTDLAIEVASPVASPTPTLDGTVPLAIADRVVRRDDPRGPGLYRRRWGVTYRGGFTREVGATQLVGPFQDPAHPECSGRVVVGQRLLDDGHAGAGTIAGAMTALIDRELRGEKIFPIGSYRRVDRLSLRWARVEMHPADLTLIGAAPHGYVRVTATVVFDRVEVPILVALVPERDGAVVHFRIAARAELAFDNRVFQWLSDKLGADKLATRLARRQIDDVLVTTLAPPPPFELPGGQHLQFTYCDGPIEITDGAWGAIPFGVAIGRLANAPQVLPPRLGSGTRPPPSPNVALALDLDVDALDAMLFELWRTGWLDRRLEEVGLDRRFNADPVVTEYLSVRISPPRLALPPVITAGPGGSLRLAADARIAIADGTTITTGRVYGALRFSLAQPVDRARLPLAVDLDALELACERTQTTRSDQLATLVPCYGDLVATVRDRGAEFHGALTEAFAKLLVDIFIDRRLGAADLPVDLVIRSALPTLAGGALHLDLDATFVPAR
jgi:hypothetical protein